MPVPQLSARFTISHTARLIEALCTSAAILSFGNCNTDLLTQHTKKQIYLPDHTK